MTITMFGRDFVLMETAKQWRKLFKLLDKYLFSNTATKLALFLIIITYVIMMATIPVHGKIKKRFNLGCLLGYAASLILLYVVCRSHTPRVISGFTKEWYKAWFLKENGYHETHFIVLVLNVTLFIPFGFLLRKYMGRKKKLWMFLIIICSAFSVEALQYIFAKGGVTVPDFASYVVGSIIGWIFMLAFDIKKRQKHAENVPENKKKIASKR